MFFVLNLNDYKNTSSCEIDNRSCKETIQVVPSYNHMYFLRPGLDAHVGNIAVSVHKQPLRCIVAEVNDSFKYSINCKCEILISKKVMFTRPCVKIMDCATKIIPIRIEN